MAAGTGVHFEWLPVAWRPGLALRKGDDGVVVGRFYGSVLSSVYQPLIDIAGGRRVGREAFVRCRAGGESGLSPWSLFSLVADDDTLVGLDRLCRTLHVLNDAQAEDADEALFLNVHGRLLAAVAEDHGRAFRRVVDALRRPAAGIVIETPEAACTDLRLLSFVLSNYRLNGFRVAVNVGGLAAVDAVLAEMRPNFVKIDVRNLRGGEERAAFVARAQAAGVVPVFTRVGDAATRDALRGLDGAWAQGFAVASLVAPSAPGACTTPHRLFSAVA